MMTDDLTNMLSRIPGLRVISRQTAVTYRGQRVDAAAVGSELGVGYVLEGSIQTRSDGLLVSVELFNTATRLRVWSGRFEKVGSDRDAIADEILKSLGRELQIKVVRVESERGSTDPGLHELVFKGAAAMFESARSGLPPLRQAEAYFTQVLAREPENRRALVGLAGIHVNLAAQLFASDPEQHLAQAEPVLRQAIERHPNDAAAHLYLGLLNMVRGQANAAVPSYARAIEIDPSFATAYAQLGRALLRLNRTQEGLDHILYAMRLSPRDPLLSYWLGYAGGGELDLGRYDKAIDYLDRALVLNPGQPRTTLVLVAAHALAGNMAEARRLLEQLQQKQPHLSREKIVERFYGTVDATRESQLRKGFRLVLASYAAGAESVADRKAAATPILVLPFTAYGEPVGSVQVTAATITDDLISALSRIPGLRVVSRETSRRYQGQPIDVAALGSDLGVRYVLEGSVHARGDRVRVNVALIDPTTRSPVWSERIDRDGSDRQGIQEQIVTRLGRELRVEVGAADGQHGRSD
jgi:TolB-like protein/Tfp pilus assembly protein PilF